MNLSPQSEDITTTKGDTVAFTMTFSDSAGTPINLTGYTVELTVDPRRAPTDDHSKLFSLVGTITNAAQGIVQFQLSDVQANQPAGTYYYDVEIQDASLHSRTVLRGKWIVEADITNASVPPTIVLHTH